MASKRANNNQTSIAHYLPGFCFYEKLGEGLAEDLVDVFEFVLSFFSRLRRYIGNRRQH
jgi:hypothetical protein